jgi:hypothetical protein
MVNHLVNNAIIVAILVLESRILNARIVLSAFKLINLQECAYPTVLTPNVERVEGNLNRTAYYAMEICLHILENV